MSGLGAEDGTGRGGAGRRGGGGAKNKCRSLRHVFPSSEK